MNYIFSCFSGSGKTTVGKMHPDKVCDLESSYFKYLNHCDVKDIEANKGSKSREVNPNFVNDYVNAIIEHHKKYKVLFISMHDEILTELKSRGYNVHIVYPNHDMMDNFIERFKSRGNTETFYQSIIDKWDYFYEKYSTMDNSHPLTKETPYIDQLLEKMGLFNK